MRTEEQISKRARANLASNLDGLSDTHEVAVYLTGTLCGTLAAMVAVTGRKPVIELLRGLAATFEKTERELHGCEMN